MTKIVRRLHDSFYLKENRYKKTKESFKFLISLLRKKIKKNKIYSIIDVGCANGELIYQLEKNFKNLEITGLDIRKDLISKAKKNVSKKVKFIKKNIFKIQKLPKFDFVICSGVVSISDNPQFLFKNMLNMVRKKGSIFIFHHFNRFKFNVFVKYQDLDNKTFLQSGWNIFSLDYIKKSFKKKKIKIYNFSIKKIINFNKSDPIRSWTIKVNKKNYFTNGLSLLLDQYWIKIDN